ncbi:MAG TPA: dolichyl-phosphate beta-glucosyltransferase [Terriglobia bacterium]|nr:dolichyl-phosphate beta-glucosyltransferase [Terriglobia bacterium]
MAEPFLSIVIPAYNEYLRLGTSLEKTRQYLAAKNFASELVIVDDGSRDQTPELLREAAARFPALRVLRNEPNQGKGYSVRRGVLEARGEFVLFTDADLSAPIEEADKLLAALKSSGADAAVGSRALQRELVGVHQPWFREYAGRGFNLLVRLFTGLRIRDTQCGLKLFRRATTRRAFELQCVTGFGFDPELLFLIERLGGKLVEVPVRWYDNPATKVRFLRDSTTMFLDLIRLRWRAWRGQYQPAPQARNLPVG